jgi:nucleoside-diphosphate-sugar epimerase
MSKKVLVTGATGYIGSYLLSHLLQAGYPTKALLRKDATLACGGNLEVARGAWDDAAFLSRATAEADIVVHLAGLKGQEACSNETEKVLEANILIVQRLLNALKSKPAKMIFASSYWVYGHKSPTPYREALPLMPSEPYGWSKALAERAIMDSGVDYTIIRLANVFGYGSGRGYEEVTSLFLKRALQGGQVLLKNGGEHSVDLISVDDVCQLFLKIINLAEKNIILNVGRGVPVTLANLAGTVNKVSKSLTGKVATVEIGPKEPDEISFADRWVDISRIKQFTGFEPVPLERSLNEFALHLMDAKAV